jgi:regulatory protein
MENQDYKARSVALRLLARREHSRLELSLKLLQRKIDNSIIESVLNDYEERGWLDDNRFADVYARQRMDHGYGLLRVIAELQQRGVHQTPECLSEITENDWCQRAIDLRKKRYGLADLSADWNERVRQARFLSRRGFTTSQVEQALSAR